MKINVCRFQGDTKILYDITEGFRNRILDQKHIYIGSGAKTYYDYDRTFWADRAGDIVAVNDWYKIITENNLFQSDQNFNYISIACGDSLKERKLLDLLGNKNINYIGIDFSEEMIMNSVKNCEGSNFCSYLIRSDIGDINFNRYLDTLGKRNEKRFFSFLGNTFGNIKTTNIVDLLGSYLKKGDILGLDVVIKKDKSFKGSIDLFNHYKNKTENDVNWRDHILSGFHYVNFPVEKGKIIIETEEEGTGLLKIVFSLEMLEDLEFELEGQIIISKGEKIQFFYLYLYEPEVLIDFMKTHHFRCLDNNIKGLWGQFLFEKE